jgi:hypothetical protein
MKRREVFGKRHELDRSNNAPRKSSNTISEAEIVIRPIQHARPGHGSFAAEVAAEQPEIEGQVVIEDGGKDECCE